MKTEFIKQLYESAKEVEKTNGIPAIFQVAQAVLESGWNVQPILDYKTTRNSYNIFGIKWHYGDYVEGYTRELINGKWFNLILRFQAYKNYADCFRDHALLLTKDIRGEEGYSYKDALEEYKNNGDIKKYVQKVSKIYATDSKYAEKILSIIEDLKKIFGIDKDRWILEKWEALSWAVEKGILKPDGSEDYWEKPVSRADLAVILKRFKA